MVNWAGTSGAVSISILAIARARGDHVCHVRCYHHVGQRQFGRSRSEETGTETAK